MCTLFYVNARRLVRRLFSASANPCVVAIVALLLFSCDTPGIRLVYPDVPASGSTGVTFQVTLEDSALAEELGWEDGVPGTLISYHRIMQGTSIQTAETDSVGSLRLPNLLSGQYRFAAYRLLRQEETGPTDGLVRAFGDGLVVWVYPPQVVEMTLRADRAGSVVISEIRRGGRYEGPNSLWPDYDYFGYFELYNNSDTTVYLDGMLWGHTTSVNYDYTPYPCSVTDRFRNDSLGIWARYFYQFPGSGSEYPLAPGQTAVVALDAVDHSQVHPSLPDLTGADFELEGTADADNPDVPNMPEVGPGFTWDLHGLDLACNKGCFLAQRTDLDALVTEFWPHQGGQYWVRIPMRSILDIVTARSWTPSMDQFGPCATTVHRSLDRLEYPEHEVYYDVSISMQRKILRIGTGGFPLLQDVGVSFSDFFLTTRSPGWLEY